MLLLSTSQAFDKMDTEHSGAVDRDKFQNALQPNVHEALGVTCAPTAKRQCDDRSRPKDLRDWMKRMKTWQVDQLSKARSNSYFQKFPKVNQFSVQAWSRVFLAIPSSRG